MKIWRAWLIAAALLSVLLILIPIRFDADVFGLLPAESSTVKGLQRFQQSFGSSEAVILAVTSDSADDVAAAMPVLAQALEQTHLCAHAIWRNPVEEHPQALAELIAYMWLNQAPESVQALVAKLQPDQLSSQLADTLERIAYSFNAGEVARLANDPFSLTTVGDELQIGARNPFSSPDGRLRVMYLGYPGGGSHFWAYRQWLTGLDEQIASLQASGTLPQGVTVRKTGNPVFVVEFGTQLLRDLSLAALGTLLVVMALFWWAHRQWRALLGLALCLTLTLGFTIVLGAAFFGSLNAVSLGFAALLMGLAVDYGLIVYQHIRAEPEMSAAKLRRQLTPSILWAAITTAGAFLILMRSSLPGLAQLGLLVAAGILVAALVVLYLFLPSVVHPNGRQPPAKTVRQMRRSTALLITGFLLLAAAGVTALAPPSIETDVNKLQFASNSAQAVHNEIQRALDQSNAELWIIMAATNAQPIADGLKQLQLDLATTPVAINTTLPTSLWPDPARQRVNLAPLGILADRRQTMEAAALEQGFTHESLQFTRDILAAWQAFGQQPTTTAPLWPQQPANQWLFSQFASQAGEHWYALGQVTAATPLTPQQLSSLADLVAQTPGATLVGWALLTEELATAMIDDTLQVLLPMLAALTILLAAAFRHWADVLLSFISLFFGLAVLAMAMSLLGWQWNIINLTALPLLLGAGVDYSIHTQLAMKRHQGDTSAVFNSVGKAILLCGTSTAVAFTSLGLGTNAGIASLGKVTALGIVIMALCAVLLLPHWWLLLRGRR